MNWWKRFLLKISSVFGWHDECPWMWYHYGPKSLVDRVVSNSNAIRAHSHSHPWLDLERRESIRECELNGIVLTNPMNPHSAQWIGIHNVAHSKINSNVNSKLNWVECASVDSTLNWTHPWSRHISFNHHGAIHVMCLLWKKRHIDFTIMENYISNALKQ